MKCARSTWNPACASTKIPPRPIAAAIQRCADWHGATQVAIRKTEPEMFGAMLSQALGGQAVLPPEEQDFAEDEELKDVQDLCYERHALAKNHTLSRIVILGRISHQNAPIVLSQRKPRQLQTLPHCLQCSASSGSSTSNQRRPATSSGGGGAPTPAQVFSPMWW